MSEAPADKWLLDCAQYLKFGETPAERIEREINDCLALMKLLEKKQSRIEELEAQMGDTIDDLTRRHKHALRKIDVEK